jgi:phosphoglycolate phosphatase
MTPTAGASIAGSLDLVIFDLDGTLVDSAPDIAWSLNALLAEIGLPPLPIETIIRFVGDGAGKLIERALSSSSESGSRHDPARLLQRFIALYADHVCVGSQLFPGIAALLEGLSGAGVKMAVITNKPHDLAQRLLAALSIAPHFAAVLGDGDGFPRKPDPSAARHVMAHLGTDPHRTVVVGDGLPDIRMAHAVPCASVAAAWGYVPIADLIAENPTTTAASPAAAAQILLPRDR